MSNAKLGKSAQSVQDVLIKSNMPCTVIELPDSTRTAQEASDAIGCRISQIIKSLIFKDKETEEPILILVSGSNRVDEQKLQEQIQRIIVKADAMFVREKTGFAIGGIPPIGHKQLIQTYIDKDLLQLSVLWAAAGTPHAVFSISKQDLLTLTKAIIIEVC